MIYRQDLIDVRAGCDFSHPALFISYLRHSGQYEGRVDQYRLPFSLPGMKNELPSLCSHISDGSNVEIKQFVKY